MNTNDFVRKLQGKVDLILRNVETGEQRIVKSNLVVNGAYSQLTYLLGGNLTNRKVANIAFGKDGTAPAETDTGVTHLAPPVWLAVTYTFPTVYSVQFTATWPSVATHADAVEEIGLFSLDTTLVARVAFDPMMKSAGWIWEINWLLTYLL